ncbi:MAG TPA: hypothetical protein VF388_09500 [Lacunisphaera sp.]
MDETEQLTRLCRNLGASPEQAEAMARQLSKRADQLVAERKLTRAAAMDYLLRLVLQGHSGAVPPEFQRPDPAGQNK